MSQPAKPPLLVRAFRRLARDLGLRDPTRAPAVWIKEPVGLAGAEVCLFASYCPNGRLAEHALFHARAWAKQGFSVVMIAALEDIALFDHAQDLGFCAGILVRANVGYDFGSWATAMRRLGGLSDAQRVVIANDSVYGPLDGFASMVEQVRGASADVVGVIESRQVRRHFQSFLVAFNRRALANPAFQGFWGRIVIGERQFVIDRYELTLVEAMEAAGLSTEALFPADPITSVNPTLTDWRGLIDRGFPYVKAQLLRENPFAVDIEDWRQAMAARGYDPALVDANLRQGKR